MSSDVKTPEVSLHEMEMIQSVLRTAGYSADTLVDGRQKLNTATLLLMQLVLSGEASPHALAEQLEQSFGRPLKYDVLFASLLPRYAIQGMPLAHKTRFSSIRAPFRSVGRDLQELEHEGGTPNPVARRRVVH